MSRLYGILNKMVDNSKIKTFTQTGTTNGDGAIGINDNVPTGAIVLAVECTNITNALCIPWRYNANNWFVKVIDWSNFNKLANTNVTLQAYYIKGGVLLNRIISLGHFRKEVVA